MYVYMSTLLFYVSSFYINILEYTNILQRSIQFLCFLIEEK